MVVESDGVRHTVREGGSGALLRGVVHRFEKFTDRDAKLLIMTTPGASCDFFEELSSITPPGGPVDGATAVALSEERRDPTRAIKHGIVQRDITSENILIPCEFSKFCRTFSLHSVAG